MGEALASLVTLTLQHGHYETRVATDRRAVETIMREWRPHLAMLDVDRYDGLMGVLGRGIEQGQMPILAFTRKRDTAVKLSAFERGADDIIEVPFTLDEIVARPYALMRRAHNIEVAFVPRIRLHALEVDLVAQRVRVEGKELSLTPLQQSLLYLLAANSGRLLSREEVRSSIWGDDLQNGSNVVDRHIRELRKKLGDDWRSPKFIETVPGKGYRFKGPAKAPTATS
jgi:DNA-binding response OmpR family regulator